MVRVDPDRVRERSGEGPGIRARKGVRRREQGRDGQAPRDGRVREIGVLDDRGAGGPQTQGSVRDTGSEVLCRAKDRWPGLGQRPCPPGCTGRTGRARAGQAGRRLTGSVAAAGGAAEPGIPRGRRWCRCGSGCGGTRCGGTGSEPAGSGPAGRARGASQGSRACQPGSPGSGTAGSLLPAAHAAGAIPLAAGSPAAWPAAGAAWRSEWTGCTIAPARPAWRAPSRAAPGQQPLQPDRYRHGPGAPSGPAAQRPARPGDGSTVRAGRPEARRRLRAAQPRGYAAAGRPTARRAAAQPEQHAAASGGRPWRPRRPRPWWSRRSGPWWSWRPRPWWSRRLRRSGRRSPRRPWWSRHGYPDR